MFAKRVDANQPAIVAAFRKMGCSVKHNHAAGQGWPDLAVGYGGLTALVEVKGEKGELNERQKKWREDWTGNVFTVRTNEDVERIVSMLRRWHTLICEGVR